MRVGGNMESYTIEFITENKTLLFDCTDENVISVLEYLLDQDFDIKKLISLKIYKED